MATNRTWYSELAYLNADISTASLSGKSLLWGIKALLTGDVSGALQGHTGARPNSSKWTVYASTNGTTAGIDSTDRWGTTFSASNMVRAAFGVARSIICLRTPAGFPGGPYYFYMDYRDTTDSSVVFAWSKNPPTAITTTSITQPADVVTANASPFVFHDATATSWKTHLAVDANGAFYLISGKAGAGNIWHFLSFCDLENAPVSDTRPVACLTEWNNGTGVSVPMGVSTTGLKCSAQNYNATTFYSATTSNVIVGAIREATGTNAFNVQMTGVSPIDGSITGFKVPVIIVTSPNWYVKGAMPDMLQVGSPVGQGSVDPASGNIDHTQIGQFRLPFNGTVTF